MAEINTIILNEPFYSDTTEEIKRTASFLGLTEKQIKRASNWGKASTYEEAFKNYEKAKESYAGKGKAPVEPRTEEMVYLSAIRTKLAKAANQRMVRLERATSKISGESLAQGHNAYTIAQDYLSKLGKSSSKEGQGLRFTESAGFGDSRADIISEITRLQWFLHPNRVTTPKKFSEIEKKRMKTFAKGGAKNAPTNKAFYDFLNSASYHTLIASGRLTSEQIIDYYEKSFTAGITPEDIVDTFNEFTADTERGEKDIKNALTKTLKGSASKKLARSLKKQTFYRKKR